jgi:hypothetical protein
MKIILFQYNREAASIIKGNNLGRARSKQQVMDNSILATGYTDRFLWEEAASLKPKPKNEYIIPGNWQ